MMCAMHIHLHKLCIFFYMIRITDPYDSLVCSMLGQLLVDGPASPFYQSLIDSNIGTEYTPNTGLEKNIIVTVIT